VSDRIIFYGCYHCTDGTGNEWFHKVEICDSLGILHPGITYREKEEAEVIGNGHKEGAEFSSEEWSTESRLPMSLPANAHNLLCEYSMAQTALFTVVGIELRA
jgi:hypothetical protein